MNAYTLREIHVNPMVVDEDVLHLEVRLLAIFLILKLNERVL